MEEWMQNKEQERAKQDVVPGEVLAWPDGQDELVGAHATYRIVVP